MRDYRYLGNNPVSFFNVHFGDCGDFNRLGAPMAISMKPASFLRWAYRRYRSTFMSDHNEPYAKLLARISAGRSHLDAEPEAGQPEKQGFEQPMAPTRLDFTPEMTCSDMQALKVTGGCLPVRPGPARSIDSLGQEVRELKEFLGIEGRENNSIRRAPRTHNWTICCKTCSFNSLGAVLGSDHRS